MTFVYFLSTIINLIVRLPLVLLSSLFYGLSDLFEKIGDGFDQGQKMTKVICMIPLLSDIEKDLKNLDEKARRVALKKLKGNLDV